MIDQPFLMPIEHAMAGLARGTAVIGRIERGIVEVGDEIEIVGFRATTKATVAEMELSRRGLVAVGRAGDEVAILLGEKRRADVEAGQVLASPGGRHAFHHPRKRQDRRRVRRDPAPRLTWSQFHPVAEVL